MPKDFEMRRQFIVIINHYVLNDTICGCASSGHCILSPSIIVLSSMVKNCFPSVTDSYSKPPFRQTWMLYGGSDRTANQIDRFNWNLHMKTFWIGAGDSKCDGNTQTWDKFCFFFLLLSFRHLFVQILLLLL